MGKHVSESSGELIDKLRGLGLDDDEARVYLALLHGGPTTALRLSESLGLARTKVYRIAERLTNKNLLERDPLVSQQLTAAPYRNLEGLLRRQADVLNQRKAELPSLFGALANLAGDDRTGARVAYYEGESGLLEVNQNTLRASGDLRAFEKESLSAVVPMTSAEEIRRGYCERGIHVRQLTNMVTLPPRTDVARFIGSFWTARYLDPLVLPITHDILIYNDVTTIYDFGDADPFCIEICSAPLARMQKQLFDFIWANAVPMKHVGKRGAAKLSKPPLDVPA